MERKGAIEMETKKKGTPPPRYDEAFKAGAVRMVTEQGRQPTEVAKELGICIDTLRSGLKSSGIQMGQASRQGREQQRIRELEAENRALRKQLGEKDEVIDILKNPSASCRNHRGKVPLRPGAEPSGNLFGAGMPGTESFSQRLLWLAEAQAVRARTAQSGAETQAGGAA